MSKFRELKNNLTLNLSYKNTAIEYFGQTTEYSILKELEEIKIISYNEFEQLCKYGQSLIYQYSKKD
jgi:hypothetical protein